MDEKVESYSLDMTSEQETAGLLRDSNHFEHYADLCPVQGYDRNARRVAAIVFGDEPDGEASPITRGPDPPYGSIGGERFRLNQHGLSSLTPSFHQ